MVVAPNKRAVMTLFSGSTDIRSHQIRLILAEKGVPYECENVTLERIPQDLIDLNPYGTIPTLVDRELTVYNPSIIAEYLDERFPHPPLLPISPIGKASSRLIIHRIEHDWYPLIMKALEKKENADTERRRLREELLSLAPVFKNAPFFMSDEFSLVDCALAPILWRLTYAGIDLHDAKSGKDILNYMQRIFNRESFLTSLTAKESMINTYY